MIDVREQVPLSNQTTFQIGGAARYFVETHSDADIREALQWARTKGVPFVIHAGGSNVLVSDAGVAALVIKIASAEFTLRDTTLTADAGCVLLAMIRATSEGGLGGWESLAGIPGTVGGAVRGNAGAFGTEMKDVVQTVEALHSVTLEQRAFTNDECQFAYRASFFKKNPAWIVLRATVELERQGVAESRALIESTIAEREKRHLQNVRAAGSYFMNPVAPPEIQALFESEKGVEARGGRVPAGWLIEKAGMKGARVGGAMASMQHPNYLINDHDAKASDVLALAEEIKQKVFAQFGIQLQEEAVIVASKI